MGVGPIEQRCRCRPHISEEPRTLGSPPAHLFALQACGHPCPALPSVQPGGDSCSPLPSGGQSGAPQWGPEPLLGLSTVLGGLMYNYGCIFLGVTEHHTRDFTEVITLGDASVGSLVGPKAGGRTHWV